MSEDLKILIVEDNADHAELASNALMRSIKGCTVEIVDNLEQSIKALKSNVYGAVLVDYYLGDINGLQILRQIKELNSELPVIIVTGLGNEKIAVDAMKLGAYDYIVKSPEYLDILPESVKKALRSYEESGKRKVAEERAIESEKQYKNLVENINIGIFRTTGSESCDIIKANPALADIFGFDSVDEFIGTHAPKIFDNFKAEERKKYLNDLIKKGTLRNLEVQLWRKDGAAIWVSISANVQYDEKGRVIWIDGTVQDITERKKAKEELERNYSKMKMVFRNMVNALAATSDIRDPFTAGHQKRVSQLACEIAAEMDLTEDEQETIKMAALVHDIGKINIPIEILSNPRHLTDLEYEMIKTHSKVGHDILKTIKTPWKIAQIIYQHHERIDGSGYPEGLKGCDILLEAKILAVADVVEAMASHRPYRPALGIDKALEEIKNNKGVLYDDDVVEACLRVFAKGFVFDLEKES